MDRGHPIQQGVGVDPLGPPKGAAWMGQGRGVEGVDFLLLTATREAAGVLFTMSL